jgi:hypothetical protein
MLSKQKISATGTATAGPSVASESRAHEADIAVAAGQPRDGRLRDIAAPDRHADGERYREGPERRQRGGEDEVDLGELFERGLRQDTVEQSRQRHIEDEEIHPGQRGIGDLLELAAGKADENQPEKRQREVENVDHAARLRPLPYCALDCTLGAAFAFL